MRAVLFALVGIVAATAPPKISLDLSARAYKLAPGIQREHDLGLKQADGSKVGSQQDWSQRCPASKTTSTANCPFPKATAKDHQDQFVAVKTRKFLVDLNGKTVNKRVSKVDFTKRSTYLFKYDATDKAGNHAEQIVFALILDDTTGPKINLCNGAAEVVQAASGWSLCRSKAIDEYNNHDLTPGITYTIKKGKVVIARDVTYAVAKQTVKSSLVGTYTLALTVADKAGMYGKDGVNNKVSVSKQVIIRDTLAPVVNVRGYSPTVVQCGASYTDAGASAIDKLDGKLAVVAKSTVRKTVGKYFVDYYATDAAGNKGTASRTVEVVDNKKPKIVLKGNSFIEVSVGDSWKDPGFSANDDCSTLNGKSSCDDCASACTCTQGRINTGKVGRYTVTYKATDAAGNTVSKQRTVVVSDASKPILTLVGKNVVQVAATTAKEYTDAGAQCKDKGEGEINHQVEVSGDTVNLRMPGTYNIKYDCMDISGNSAVQLTRKVVVSDKQCPKITLKGKNTVTSEAGFPYKDAGATAFDALDGDLTPAIWTDGDTINVYKTFKDAMSCHEIKTKYPEARTGGYHVSPIVGKDFKQIHVWCDMKSHKKGKKAAGYTYKLLPSGKKCSDFGLEAPKTITKFAQQKFGKATLCAMNDEDVALDYGRKIHAPHSHPGTYKIRYHVVDRNGNRECKTPIRTVFVKDTLPPVIKVTLKGQTKLSAKQASPRWGAAYMAESTTVNGWILAAAASAVTGLALLAISKKSATVAVPV
jgi:hypothetical protein